MRISINRSLALFVTLSSTLFVGCDQQPLDPASDQLEPTPVFSHGPAGIATGQATFHPMNGSRVRGALSITDDGSELMIAGTADGLDPLNTIGYISLFYGIGSVPGGPRACEPAPDPANRLSEAQMFIGFWTVDSDGSGTLGPVTMSGDAYASVDRISTVSIRDLRIGDGDPQEAVRACGKIAVHPAGK